MRGKKVLLGLAGLIFAMSCGTIEATPDMTMNVQPESITFIDSSGVRNVSVDTLHVGVYDTNSKPAKGVKVTAFVDTFFANNSLVWFPDCNNSAECSCTTNDLGRCVIRVGFAHGNVKYTANVIVYSGSLSKVITLCMGTQSNDC